MIFNKELFERGDRVLAAVSGGVDSMVMLDLLVENSREFGLDCVAVAHCNFMLRGAESDRETTLVAAVCARHGIECHTTHFDTKTECLASGESTQMAARRLRYDFFEKLCAAHNYNRVAIAHNAGDSAETFFVNLTRGSGLRGLTGISASRGLIVRPMLGISREMIEKYAAEHAVEFLNDSSNASLDYLRNRLRHDIIPRLDHSVPAFFSAIARTMTHLDSAQKFIDEQVDAIRRRLMQDNVLDIEALRTERSFDFLLFEILHPYAFSSAVVEDIAKAEATGREFFSETHRAVLDRGRLLITARVAAPFVEREIQRDDPAIEWLTVDNIFSLDTPSNEALLAADALQFPLRLRRWQAGDWFVPLGLKGQKKVSDYLVDSKVSIVDKEQQGVLISGSDTIVWLVGRRIDDRFKVTEQSGEVIKITL